MPKRQFERLEQLTQHVAAASLGPSPAAAASAGKQYDLVLANGRVIDPESGTDAVLNVGIIGDRVAALGPADAVSPADAAAVRDCTGLIVAPGFIDLHAHGQNNESARLQACDGVTTHLELEVGTWPVESFLAEREALGAVINFGTSVGHIPARAAAITGSAVPLSIANDPCCMIEAKQFEGTEATGHRETASPAQLKRLMAMLGDGLTQGGIGIGAGIVYTPGAGHKEIYELVKAVGRYGVALFVHIRGGQKALGFEDFHEMFANAAVAGAAVHICHSLSSGRSVSPGTNLSGWNDVLEMATRLNLQGVDISLEQYPYPYGCTNLRTEQSSTWNPMQLLRQVRRADNNEIITGPAAAQAGRTVDGSPTEIPGEVLVGGWSWVETGEFLTEDSYNIYYERGGLAYGHWSDKEAACMDAAMLHPLMIVASDGIPFVDGLAHPRGAGTFSRFLGQYVREKELLSWSDALRKCTLGPAKRLETFCPAMLTKGRIGVGMDADITVFDPASIIDRATLAEPATPSAGIVHVVVNGTLVLDGGVETGALPGKAVRGQPPVAPETSAASGGGGGVASSSSRKVRKTTELFSALLESQSTSFLEGFDC